MSKFSDKKIIESWHQNHSPWVSAINENKIKSRILVTNDAIVKVIQSISAKTALDIGCGEGWLVRELTRCNIHVSGLDVVPELVNQAKRHGAGNFWVTAYEDISTTLITEKYNLAVCNFSLLGKESVEHVFQIVPQILIPNGYFIIQSLHPHAACGSYEYKDGWREGTWNGFSDDFKNPPPWYFRTIESWLKLFHHNNFELVELKEPLNPQTGDVSSIILVGRILSC